MTIGVDIRPVENEYEALTLMIHHLDLAAAYFEATPEEIPVSNVRHHFSFPAIIAWVGAMEKLYPKEPDYV